jgi:hypothetical protein
MNGSVTIVAGDDGAMQVEVERLVGDATLFADFHQAAHCPARDLRARLPHADRVGGGNVIVEQVIHRLDAAQFGNDRECFHL